jgi:hypothetical protein
MADISAQQSLGVLASPGYQDYEGIALKEAGEPRLVQDLGSIIYLTSRNWPVLAEAPTHL